MLRQRLYGQLSLQTISVVIACLATVMLRFTTVQRAIDYTSETICVLSISSQLHILVKTQRRRKHFEDLQSNSKEFYPQ